MGYSPIRQAQNAYRFIRDEVVIGTYHTLRDDANNFYSDEPGVVRKAALAGGVTSALSLIVLPFAVGYGGGEEAREFFQLGPIAGTALGVAGGSALTALMLWAGDVAIPHTIDSCMGAGAVMGKGIHLVGVGAGKAKKSLDILLPV